MPAVQARVVVQVGAVTGIQARCVWRVSQGVSARVALRVGTSGVDLEVGGTQRISEFSAAGLAVAVGLYVSAFGYSLLTPRSRPYTGALDSALFLIIFEAGSDLLCQKVQRTWYHILQVCLDCCMYKSCPWP